MFSRKNNYFLNKMSKNGGSLPVRGGFALRKIAFFGFAVVFTAAISLAGCKDEATVSLPIEAKALWENTWSGSSFLIIFEQSTKDVNPKIKVSHNGSNGPWTAVLVSYADESQIKYWNDENSFDYEISSSTLTITNSTNEDVIPNGVYQPLKE